MQSARPSPPSPTATRPPTRRWRDPRLIVGILIVAGSVLLGSWAVASADDTASVWSVRDSLPAGARLRPADLEARRVHLSGGTSARYLSTASEVDGRVLARAVGAGELLPSAAISPKAGIPGTQVPLSIEGDLPAAIRAGSVVEAWVVPREAVAGGTRARRVSGDLVVVDVPEQGDRLAPTATSTVLLRVTDAADVAELLGATTDGRIVLTVRGER